MNMPTPSFLRFRVAILGVAGVTLALALPGFAANAKKEKANATATKASSAAAGATGDSAPILMSRTGGGSTFADVNELKAAAEKGNPKAEAQFGEMLLRGDATNAVVQDRAAGIAMLEKAARAGESSAAFRIGMLLDDGDGVTQDRVRALAYFKAAAAGGANEAYHNIGAAYASARGVKRDYAEGLAWLILAKKRGAQSDAEQALRDRMQKLGRPEMLAAAEKRAGEIERELARQKPVDLLPPPAAFNSGDTASVATPPALPKLP